MACKIATPGGKVHKVLSVPVSSMLAAANPHAGLCWTNSRSLDQTIFWNSWLGGAQEQRSWYLKVLDLYLDTIVCAESSLSLVCSCPLSLDTAILYGTLSAWPATIWIVMLLPSEATCWKNTVL